MMRWIINIIRRLQYNRQHIWRQVPPPNWRSSRGGKDFW